MNCLLLADDTSTLGIPPSNLSIILSKKILFLFPHKNICPPYVIPILSINLIANHFMIIVLEVTHHLILFKLMCGGLQVILELMDQNITSSLLTIIQNTFNSIRWTQNLVSLKSFHISKSLSKIDFKNQ